MTEHELRIVKTCVYSGAEALRRRNPHRPGLVARNVWDNACKQAPAEIVKFLQDYLENGVVPDN